MAVNLLSFVFLQTPLEKCYLTVSDTAFNDIISVFFTPERSVISLPCLLTETAISHNNVINNTEAEIFTLFQRHVIRTNTNK